MADTPCPLIYSITKHARERQLQRSISRAAMEAALDFGRVIHTGRGVRAYFLGHRELRKLSRLAPSMAKPLWPFKGTTVLISNHNASLVTTYRCSHPRQLGRARR